jgi:putative DNA primase/helicase
MRPKQWLWPGRLLRGAQEMFSGQPGLGKSQVQIDWVARATTGRDWPDGAPGFKPVDVMMLTAEDTLDQEVVPRLHAAEADLERVHIIKCIRKDKMDRQFLLDEDLNRLRETVLDVGNVGLITIDPITAYMGGKIDSHKTTEVRSQLGPLKDFAEQMNIAISTITHPPKGGGQRAIDSFIGSQAFIAACRIGHLSIEEIEVDEETREKSPTGRLLFCDVKNNAARKGATLAYQIKEVTVSGSNPFDLITAPRIVWEKDAVNISADDALAAHAGSGRGRKSDEQIEAQKFLREMLKDGARVAQKVIIEEATARGFSTKQLRTAREALGIQPSKAGLTGGWEWKLKPPPEPLPAPQGQQQTTTKKGKT